MTLIIAMPCQDGVVLASDGQATRGEVRAPTRKIKRWGENCIWAGAGSLALIQRVEQQLATLPPAPLENVCDQIAQVITHSVRQLLQLDFRTPFFQNDPRVLQSLCPGDFVFVQACPEPKILHIPSIGTPEWIVDSAFASGSGDLFAYALLGKYWNNENFRARVTTAEGSILAYKVIEEAILVVSYGLGEPIDIWVVRCDKQEGSQERTSHIYSLSETGEIAGIVDTVKSIRSTEIELILGGHQQEAEAGNSASDYDIDIDFEVAESDFVNPFR